MIRHKSLSTTERYVRGLTSIRPYLKVLEGGRSKQETQTPFTSDLLPEARQERKRRVSGISCKESFVRYSVIYQRRSRHGYQGRATG